MNDTYRKVFENNRKWIESHTSKKPEFFEHLAKGQSPEFLFISCADSRVPVNNIMGLDPGEVFVHRNVANLVVNTDMNIHSVILYAIMHLKVKHVVVCGHYNCGGVAAAMGNQSLGLIDGWLREIRDVYRLHATELDAIKDEGTRYNRLIELNVFEQCNNILKTEYFQKSHADGGAPSVHGWVFDISKGELIDLDYDYKGQMDRMKSIYDING
ncbi:MAG: carbonic anhydrase [Schleiferiaceae bacterium]|nr:carbonic anhydrase [Schleiferiaceae bacterium]